MRWVGVALLTAMAACSTREVAPAPERDAVAAAWEHYVATLKLVNSDSVAAMFTDSAEMFQSGAAPIRGRAAIRGFLAPFDGHAHVDSVTSTTMSISVYGDAAYQWGSYHQVARLDAAPAGSFDGRFVAEWRRGGDGSWKMRRILMQPGTANGD